MSTTIEEKKINESSQVSLEIQKQFASMFERLIPKEIQKVEIISKPEKFSLTRIERGVASNTSKPTEPTIKFKNPVDRISSVDEISIIPNGAFKTVGRVVIAIDGASVYESTTAATFTDVTDSGIKFNVGKSINSEQEVEVYIWSDGAAVALTVQVTFGE